MISLPTARLDPFSFPIGLSMVNCLDCGIPETLLSTNKILLEHKKDNFIHDTAVIDKSNLSFCTISENCYIENSDLNNVIMLAGSKVLNQKINNKIIGFDEVFHSEDLENINGRNNY